MYTGAPEKCLEVFALKKKKKLKEVKFPHPKQYSSTPCQKQKEKNKHVTYLS